MPLPAAALRFDRFTLLPNERQLLAEGEPVKLGGRAFDLLLVLVERRERTVTRSELFELVWAGRIVEDHNLQVQVLALRKVLGPTAIATIPGRGYRFAMRLLDGPEQAAAPAAGVPTAAPVTAPAVASMTAATSRAGALAQSNLPAVGSALHGRVNDIAAVFRLLGEHRLVTLAGAGGIGKTRLAQAVANQLRSRFPDGVWMVELASVGDEPEQICSALAGVLGLTASPLAGNADDLARALSSLDLLLVLDNCEHLVDSASTLVRALLERAPKVHVLVTSQEPLHARGEQVYRLGSLENGAVALFVERVQGADRRFVLSASNTAAVTDICRRLDGNPLAIELAAARTPLLGVEGVRSRLDERFRLLTGGASDAPQRHRTLLDTIEWSHSLLAADEQAVFRRLGVFAGSFSLDAARLVASGGSLSEWAVLDHLCALVDKSLVLVDGSGDVAHEHTHDHPHDAEPRYRMLESPRAYALEALAACGEVIATRRRHAHVMLDLFARADDTYHLDPTLAWMARLAPDVHNCREAFGFSMSAEGEPATAIGIAATAATFASATGRGREGHRALQRAWPLLAEHGSPQWQARAWLGLAQLGSVQAITPDEAVHAAQQAADAFRAIDDRERLYRALYMLSQYAENSALMPLAEQATEEMKRVESSEWPSGLKRLGRLRDARRLRSMGRIAESRDAFDDQAQRCLADGDEHRAWVMLHHVALAEVALGNFERAASVMRGAVEQIRRHGLMREMWQQVAMHALTEIECAIERGDPAMALPAVREVAGLLKVQASVWWLADHMAWLPELRGDSDSAARLLGWADAQARSRNAKRGPIMQKARDRLAARLENNLDADRLARLQADGAALRDDEVLAVALREPG